MGKFPLLTISIGLIVSTLLPLSCTQSNSNAMHACMIASRPSLIYWNDISVRLIKAAADLRRDGLETYTTVDAGPHVCFLARRDDLDAVKEHVDTVEGVVRTTVSLPGGAAEIVEQV